jgi:putative aminopeptidase FrvX
MSNQDAIELLKELCLAHGAPSHEAEVAEIFFKHLANVGTITKDKLGGVLCTTKASPKDKPRILVTGHMDEVGFAVQNIMPDGFLQIVPLGGWWTHNLLSQRLVIKTKSGKKVLGVVASIPPHFLKPSQRTEVLPLDSLFVDIGAKDRDAAENDFGVSLGDPIVPDSSFETLNDPDLLLCKAFDNRVGMAVTIQVLKNLAKHNGDITLLGAGTVQEEVGLRGARVMAVHAQPDVALILEGPPADDTPGMNRAESQGRLTGGAQIRVLDPSAIMNPRLVDHVIGVAKKEKIPYQVTVRKSGGTDAGSFHIANEGIPSIVIGVPARYIHTHNSIIHKDDYLAAIKLVEAVVRSFDAKSVAALTD